MLRPSRCPADRRHELQARGVVPGLFVLQAPTHAEEALARRLPVLAGISAALKGHATRRIPAPAPPTRLAARAAGRSASAAAPPATGPSSRTSPPGRSAHPRRRG